MCKTKLTPIAQIIQSTSARPPTPERYKLCTHCGQSYDAQQIGENFHHTGEPHGPLPDA